MDPPPPLTAGRPMMDVRVAGLVNVITTIVAVMFVIVAVAVAAAAAAEVDAAIGAPMPMTTTTAPGRGCLGRRMHVAMANAAIVTNDGKIGVAIIVSNHAIIEEILSKGE